ncbi:uncharacterized protein LOC131679380 [Topomyia yanbarensis]|uniref:uncharacterized protein LOC131679380 n=1 Tax=Topomyia yanbarensis TaxID=2498891 RepID=UPI00273CA966|nr:uncharacterized protein LOC131679380 [Topomyia yanbarensis]
MSNERRIKSLKLRLRSIMTSFNLIKTFVDDYDEENHAPEVPVRLENLIALWTDFNKMQCELESLDEASIEQQLKQRTDIESHYYRVKGFLLSVNKMPSTPCAPSSSLSNALIPSSTSHVRLPDVKLPMFSGNLESWLNFHDLYLSLVHSSQDLSNIQKFYYLRSSLSGDALKLIQTIPLSANNYPVAWNLLVEHFQNPARLKQSYVDALFEFPSIKRESAVELHSLVEKFEANVKILQQLGEKTEFWDILLVRMLSTRLDHTTRRDWEEHSSTLDAVSFRDLTAFIQRRVTVLQNMNGKLSEVPPPAVIKKQPNQRPLASHGASQFSARKCIICSDQHPLYLCTAFSKLSAEEKEKEVRRHQLCRNCLRKGHMCRDCPSTSTCRKCRGRHHTQLCTNDTPNCPKISDPLSSKSSNEPPTVSVSASEMEPKSYASAGRTSVLLATAAVIVIDDAGTHHVARALLDSGSECCFATESFAQLIKAQRKKISVPIAGIGHSATQARYMFSSTVRSRLSDYSTTADFLVLPKVTVDLPSTSVDISHWKIPSGVHLADPSFCTTNPIDLILGAELFFDLFRVSGRITLGDNLPVLVNSVFGWVVSGRVNCCSALTPITANVASVTDLHQLMENFWVIEEGDSSPCYSVEESACEDYFRRTVTRSPEGRYIVRLPFKKAALAILGDNRRTAVRRFRLLETRLHRDRNLAQQYCSFMKEYHDQGHMQRLAHFEDSTIPLYHLPHHAVIREESTTTKVRVVFDASCKTSSGKSLNDALLVGPIVQDDLRSIIMRSRIHPVMLIADIKQMYRQILVDERDTSVQRIVWRASPDDSLDTFELKTVTYGTASAPYLATRVLQQLADDEQDTFPEAADVLRKDFYVDDLISGRSTVAEAIKLRNQLDSLLAKGGFELRKWASNEPTVLEDIPEENRALQQSVDLDRDQCLKTLGLHWEPSTDVLRYKIKIPLPETNASLTKRMALSYIAQLFDPLGLVGPVVTTAKLFMQMLWTLKNRDGTIWSWDEELPVAIQERWYNYHIQLPLLNQLRIERFAMCLNPSTVQLHFFSDASEQAYGACAYLRSEDSNGNVKVALLTAKSKVAPLKKQTIPRLELCGALLASQLYQNIIKSLSLEPEAFFWVDSMTVISWLRAAPSTWTTFVANRVSKIQLATINCTWSHVAGYQNPADYISRGTTAEFLINSEQWWHGPLWINFDRIEWPQLEIIPSQASMSEARKPLTTNVTATAENSFIDTYVSRFSNYQYMLRVTAYCKRFLQNSRPKNSHRPISHIVTAEELNEAEITLIRLVQQQTFNSEWKALEKQHSISTRSRIKWFTPFLSTDRLIRVGGRLARSQQTYDNKHQIILPSSHQLVVLLIRHYHEKHLHAAPQLLLGLLRLRYWITGARNLARKIVNKCTVCFRARPNRIEQFMSELPAARVTAARPFTTTGIDYWGPIYIQPPHRRSAPRKAYVALFVCFCTKAVHLELVADLTTTKFLQALRRFVSRRGLCADIHSDNGRNFIGAANELRQLIRSKEHRELIAQECAQNGIRWHFNPPKASHFGGLWEAAIQSAQKHFIRVLGTHTLPYDDMETLLSQIESCLNSRPLVPMSDDPTDFEPLTPGHFLVGSALKAVPDVDYTTIPFSRLRKWQQTQHMFQHIWKRWHREYLATLQPRSKWCNPPVQLARNQLVILRDDNLPPMQWPTARIDSLHPGPDGVVRVVTVQTPTGRYTRPVAKICLLPISSASKLQVSTNEDSDTEN